MAVAEHFYTFLKSPRAKRNALLILMWAGVLIPIVVLREVLLPVLRALLIAYVIDPVVRRLAQVHVSGRKISRANTVILLYLALFASTWLAAALFMPQIYREVARLTVDGTAALNTIDDQRIEAWAHRVETALQGANLPVRIVAAAPPVLDGHSHPKATIPETTAPNQPLPTDVHDVTAPNGGPTMLTVDVRDLTRKFLRAGTDLVGHKVTSIFGRVQTVLTSVVRLLFTFILVLMLTAFIEIDTERMKRFFFTMVPGEDRDAYDALLERIDRGLSGVVRGQLTICLINGMLTLVGLLLLQVKFAFILASLAAVFSLIPIFGSILSTAPIFLVAMTQGATTAVLSIAWIMGIHLFEANFLNPKILGDAAKIHPAVIIFCLVAGEHFYGIVGALFAVPICSIFLTIFRSLQAKAVALGPQVTATVPPAQVPTKEDAP